MKKFLLGVTAIMLSVLVVSCTSNTPESQPKYDVVGKWDVIEVKSGTNWVEAKDLGLFIHFKDEKAYSFDLQAYEDEGTYTRPDHKTLVLTSSGKENFVTVVEIESIINQVMIASVYDKAQPSGKKVLKFQRK